MTPVTTSLTALSPLQGPTPAAVAATATVATLGIGYWFYTIPTLIKNIVKMIHADTLIARIKAAVHTVLYSGSLVNSISSTIDTLKTVSVIAKDTLTWTSTVAKVLYPLHFVWLAIGGLQTKALIETRAEMKQKLTVSKKKPLAERVTNLTNALEHVSKNRTLQKTLGISKKADLDTRIGHVAKQITASQTDQEKEEAVARGEKLMKSLKTRVNTQLTCNILSQVLLIASIIVTGILLFVTPVAPVVLGISVAVTVVSVAAIALEKVLVNKDPFSPPADVWYEKALFKIRQGIYSGAHAISKLFKHPERILCLINPGQ